MVGQHHEKTCLQGCLTADQVGLKPACSTTCTEDSYSLGIMDIAPIGIILCRQ